MQMCYRGVIALVTDVRQGLPTSEGVPSLVLRSFYADCSLVSVERAWNERASSETRHQESGFNRHETRFENGEPKEGFYYGKS